MFRINEGARACVCDFSTRVIVLPWVRGRGPPRGPSIHEFTNAIFHFHEFTNEKKNVFTNSRTVISDFHEPMANS